MPQSPLAREQERAARSFRPRKSEDSEDRRVRCEVTREASIDGRLSEREQGGWALLYFVGERLGERTMVVKRKMHAVGEGLREGALVRAGAPACY